MPKFLIFPIIWIIFITRSQGAAIPIQQQNNNMRRQQNYGDQYIEVRPNATLILRSVLENPSNAMQEITLFKTILNAIRMVPSTTGNTFHDISVKMYGEGVEHKFPPFLENIIQRIQTYFSVYRYTDTSEPLRDKYKPTVAYNESESNEIDINLSSHNRTTKPLASTKPEPTQSITSKYTTSTPSTTSKKPKVTTTQPSITKKPSVSTQPLSSKQPSLITKPTSSKKPIANSSATTSSTTPLVSESSDENEFIEIKKFPSK